MAVAIHPYSFTWLLFIYQHIILRIHALLIESFIRKYTHSLSFISSFTNSLIHSFILFCDFFYSFTYLVSYSFTHSLDSLIYSFMHLNTCLLIHSCKKNLFTVSLFIQSFTHKFTSSLSFIASFMYFQFIEFNDIINLLAHSPANLFIHSALFFCLFMFVHSFIHSLTSQWLNTSCGLARPLVLFLISSANPKLSATGRTALMMNMSVPSFISSCRTRPSRFDKTPYIRPTTQRDIYKQFP